MQWLSTGRVLERFVALLPQLKEFLAKKKQIYPEPSDREVLLHNSFFTDITEYLNILNKILQGSHHITSLYSATNVSEKTIEL